MSEEVREDYLESLEELTVNSRPIIKTLTEIAQENVADAKAVAEAIEMHILRCAPNHKLPALYLVDCICKNIGDPYNSLFIPRIVGMFTNAFAVAPEPLRMKLNELFKTWTITVPATGQPVFPHEILRQINDFLMRQQMAQMSPNGANGMDVPGAAPVGPGSLPPARPRLNQSALMVEINRFRQLLENDNNDQFNERQLSLLARVEAQISGVVDPKILPEIQTNLDEMKSAREQHMSRAMNSNPRRGGKNQNGGNNSRRDNRRNVPGRDNNNNYGGNGAGNGNGSYNGGNNNNDSNNRRGDHKDRRANGGVGKATSTNNVPLGTRKGRSPKPSGAEIAAIAEDTLAKAASQSRKNVDSEIQELSLATACEQTASQTLIDQLYSEGLPLQCSTCGYRFHDTEEGRAAKEAEMDWHFRANKDIREGHSRNRSWFLVATSWVSYRDEDEVFGLGSTLTTTAGVMNSSGSKNGGASSNNDEDVAVDLEKEREKYTEVPLESNVVCPVCQEPHETSWSEEAENWVWMNTVEIEGHYFHATCYADPQNKQLVASVLEQKI